MPRLSPSDLASRLTLDYRAVVGLSREALGAVHAVSTSSEPRALSDSEGLSGRATRYVVEYRFTYLVGKGQTAGSATAFFDLLAGGNYPYSPPGVWILSRPVPWTPHVHPVTGTVCLGDGWVRASGRMLLAQLVVHVARLLNFDEPGASTSAAHWNASAVHYWRSELGGGPYLRDLAYPRLPAEVTHGLPDASSMFRAAEAFSPADESAAFHPIGVVQ